MTATHLSTLCCVVPVSDSVLAKLRDGFQKVHYHPDENIPKDVLGEVDMWFTNPYGLPKSIVNVDQIPRTICVQITSAGANRIPGTPVFKSPQARKQIKLCSASGIHSFSIPQYIISHIVNLYAHHQMQLYLLRSEDRWVNRDEIASKMNGGKSIETRSIYGKTVGMLGYGHIARETARVLRAMNATIIAANSSGEQRDDDGYIIEGTGDKDGSIPTKYYSTNDPKSFKEFLSRSEVLVASLPSTSQTTHLLKKEHFDMLPDQALFINVGRGDLAHSNDILAALDAPNGLAGVALDVTDPEPLPDHHPLFSHPRAIITPHTSGGFTGYLDGVADMCLANAKQYRETGKFFNVIDYDKGY